MKRQFGLLLSSAAFVIATTAVAAAQVTRSSHPFVKAHSEVSAMAKGGPGGNFSAFEELDLTDEQAVEMEAIQAGIVEQMSEVLTPEQIEALAEAHNGGDRGSMRSMMMGLDRSQRSSVMGIMRSAQSDMMDVLTAEQRAQIEGSRPRDRN
ncbi:MAG: Spy/CpxP family protein refolding chaperone [Cyanobacteria bacterium J06634_6]